jgi:hypothetical protein
MEATLTAEEKSTIYDILVSSDVWKNFFMYAPPRSERSHNIKALFGDICSSHGRLQDERENVVFLYEFADVVLHPHIKNIFARFDILWSTSSEKVNL